MKATKRWILILEDDEDDLELTKRALRRVASGIGVQTAVDGETALDVLSRPDVPSLVLMDAHMPKLSGTSLLHRAKLNPNLRSVPFVVFSSSIGPNEQQSLMSEGASEVVIKPLDYDEYTESLAKVVRDWLDPAD